MIDWSTGVLGGLAPVPDGPRWRLICAADWMPRGGHIPAMIDDPVGFYGDLLPTLADADLRLVNVECVIGEEGTPIPKAGPNLRVDSRTIGSLTSVPFDVGCLANNHTLDFGPDGLARTLDLVRSAGLATVGAGLDGEEAARPLTTTVRGTPVAVINCGEGEACRSVDGGPGAYGIDLVAVGRQIRELKAAGSTVVVVFHGGREHVPVPPPYVVHDLRAIADMGADVVIGHHPHVPQGIELHNGVPIAYSLGNFAFHFATDAFYQHVGYVLCVDFAGGRVAGVEAAPYLIEPSGLRRLTGSGRAAFADGLTRATAALADEESIRAAWDAVVDHYMAPDAAGPRLAKGAEAVAAGDRQGMAAAANLFFTPAHSELMSRGLRRLSVGQAGTAPGWARDLLAHYLEFPIIPEG